MPSRASSKEVIASLNKGLAESWPGSVCWSMLGGDLEDEGCWAGFCFFGDESNADGEIPNPDGEIPHSCKTKAEVGVRAEETGKS